MGRHLLLQRCLWTQSAPRSPLARTAVYRSSLGHFPRSNPSHFHCALLHVTPIAAARNRIMASTDVLSQTLSSITAIKLDQLQKQKDAYESKKRSLCEEVVSEVDTAKRAKKLLKGSEELQPLGLKSNAALSSLSEFFDQAEFDPSVTEPLLKEYEAEIHNHLRAQTNKYEFASLYGKLV